MAQTTFQGLKRTMSDFSDISEFRGSQEIIAFLLSKSDFAKLGAWSHALVHERENGKTFWCYAPVPQENEGSEFSGH